MRVLLQPGFILHRRQYLNSSLLLEVLSRDYGRLSIVARGAASRRSKLKGLLQPFIPLILSWIGFGELKTLIAAEDSPYLAHKRIYLENNLLLSGMYLNELLVHLLPQHDPLPGVFNSYKEVLYSFMTSKQDVVELTLRLFEKRLLEELGYGLLLNQEANGTPLIPGGCYYYILDRGPVKASSNTIGIPISGRGLLALYNGTIELSLMQEVKALTRAAIDKYLCGRKLKTRQIYCQYITQKNKHTTV